MKAIKFTNGEEIPLANIFCIGQNYSGHNKEMGTAQSEDIIVFMKPSGSFADSKSELVLPSISKMVHHEVELVLVIGKDGYNIEIEDAKDYIAGYGLGIDYTLRDVQADAKKRGIPWTTAKGFYKSAPVSQFYPRGVITNDNFELKLFRNGELKQIGNTSEMIHSSEKLVSFISKIFSLTKGDIIFTGTPEGVGQVISGDIITAFLNDDLKIETTII